MLNLGLNNALIKQKYKDIGFWNLLDRPFVDVIEYIVFYIITRKINSQNFHHKLFKVNFFYEISFKLLVS